MSDVEGTVGAEPKGRSKPRTRPARVAQLCAEVLERNPDFDERTATYADFIQLLKDEQLEWSMNEGRR